MPQSETAFQVINIGGTLFFRAKDPFSNIYLNKGAYSDAIHFLQADPEPDEKKKRPEKKRSVLRAIWSSFCKMIYRFYLLLWFSLYFSINLLGKLWR